MPPTDGTFEHESRQIVDDAAIASAKVMLRRAILLRRDVRTDTDRRSADGTRFELLRARLDARLPTVAAAYLSSANEPGTLQLVAWLAAHDVTVLLPVLTDPAGGPRREPAWAPYAGPDALQIGVRSILEPTTGALPVDALARAELIVCPALAASPAGERLGRGGGWYDRALAHAGPGAETWALLNDDEVLNTIPTQPWDRRVAALATPIRFIDCRA